MATTTETKQCGCRQPVGTAGGADYQDAAYGKGQRVFNVTREATKETAKCTCCGKAA